MDTYEVDPETNKIFSCCQILSLIKKNLNFFFEIFTFLLEKKKNRIPSQSK